ncbi:MAG: hypothetical protein ACQEW2_02305 [Bacillota bacterium]
MNLSEKQLEVISKAAAQAAFEHLEKERQKREKQKYDRRLRNIKLLLKNYRSFVAHSAEIKLEINDLNAKLELDELDTDEFAIESIKRSKHRTLAMVKFINRMVAVYKSICEQSGNQEDIRKYETIYNLYIAEDKKTVSEISEMHFLSSRMVYKNIDNACEVLTVLVFGVDGIKFK